MIKQNMFRGFKASYHRNGTMGEGFYLCRFLFRHCGNDLIDMQAIVFDGPGRVAVTSERLNDRWRGDEFEPALRAAIAAAQSAQPETLYA